MHIIFQYLCSVTFPVPISYHMPVYRPPSEADALILQVTLGCSWNQCAFCEMYTKSGFTVRDAKSVEKEIAASAHLAPFVKKVFLADGNAMSLSTRRLMPLAHKINATFPHLKRISAYALPRDIQRKDDKELKMLRKAGISRLYVGIESGDDEVLSCINKGESFQSTADALIRAKRFGFEISAIILNGVGGKKYSPQHAIKSAEILNVIQPEYAAVLVLSFPTGEAHYRQRFNGEYIPMTVADILSEMELFIKHTKLKETVFRSNHASNYLVLRGTLCKDKEVMLRSIRHAIEHPDLAGLRKEWMRGL